MLFQIIANFQYIFGKNLHISGPVQFKSVSIKGQLYIVLYPVIHFTPNLLILQIAIVFITIYIKISHYLFKKYLLSAHLLLWNYKDR